MRGNDPFLYGEKVKAYLRRGAKPLPGYRGISNAEVGWERCAWVTVYQIKIRYKNIAVRRTACHGIYTMCKKNERTYKNEG